MSLEAFSNLDTILKLVMQKKAKEYNIAALDKTTKLLDLNPEFYTIWNYRRSILVDGLFPDSYVPCT